MRRGYSPTETRLRISTTRFLSCSTSISRRYSALSGSRRGFTRHCEIIPVPRGDQRTRPKEIFPLAPGKRPTRHNHNVCGIKTLPFIHASQPSLICFCFEILRPTSVVWCHVHFLELSLSFRSVGYTYSVVSWDFLHRIASRSSPRRNRSLPALI